MVEAAVSPENVVAAFRRLRSHWDDIFDGPAESPEERESVLGDIGEDLSVVTAAARVSEEAAPFVETAFRARMGELGNNALTPALAEVGRSLRSAFENLIRALQQMESSDDILPEAGREMRRSAARAVAFFHEVRGPDGGEKDAQGVGADPHRMSCAQTAGGGDDDVGGDEDDHDDADADVTPPESRDAVMERLVQSYDGRRKMIREDTEVLPPAVEAVEFLLRLGAG